MIIAIATHKGGVGKTTTTLNLGAALREQKKKVMLIDLDGQCNLTTSFGLNPNNPSSVGRVLSGQLSIKEIVKRVNGIDVVPSAYDLVTMEKGLTDVDLLETALEQEKKNYDYILIDCPPSLGIMTLNALVCADYYLIPCLAETYSYDAINKLNETVAKLRKKFNPSLKLAGVLFVMHSLRQKTMLGRKIQAAVEDSLPTFKTAIRNNIALVECVNYQQDVFLYDRENKTKSNGATDYLNLSNEIVAL